LFTNKRVLEIEREAEHGDGDGVGHGDGESERAVSDGSLGIGSLRSR
jgi:hypothetical protein